VGFYHADADQKVSAVCETVYDLLGILGGVEDFPASMAKTAHKTAVYLAG